MVLTRIEFTHFLKAEHQFLYGHFPAVFVEGLDEDLLRPHFSDRTRFHCNQKSLVSVDSGVGQEVDNHVQPEIVVRFDEYFLVQ